jgi:hypothetical protein
LTIFSDFSWHLALYLPTAVSKFPRCCIFTIAHIVSNRQLFSGLNCLLLFEIPIPIFWVYTQILSKVLEKRTYQEHKSLDLCSTLS